MTEQKITLDLNNDPAALVAAYCYLHARGVDTMDEEINNSEVAARIAALPEKPEDGVDAYSVPLRSLVQLVEGIGDGEAGARYIRARLEARGFDVATVVLRRRRKERVSEEESERAS